MPEAAIGCVEIPTPRPLGDPVDTYRLMNNRFDRVCARGAANLLEIARALQLLVQVCQVARVAEHTMCRRLLVHEGADVRLLPVSVGRVSETMSHPRSPVAIN